MNDLSLISENVGSDKVFSGIKAASNYLFHTAHVLSRTDIRREPFFQRDLIHQTPHTPPISSEGTRVITHIRTLLYRTNMIIIIIYTNKFYTFHSVNIPTSIRYTIFFSKSQVYKPPLASIYICAIHDIGTRVKTT